MNSKHFGSRKCRREFQLQLDFVEGRIYIPSVLLFLIQAWFFSLLCMFLVLNCIFVTVFEARRIIDCNFLQWVFNFLICF